MVERAKQGTDSCHRHTERGPSEIRGLTSDCPGPTCAYQLQISDDNTDDKGANRELLEM